MRAVYVVCLRYPRLVAGTHISLVETLVVSSVTPRTAPWSLRSTPREDETARARPVSYFQPRFVFQQLEKRSWWPDEAGQLRFDSCWKKVQGVRHAPCVSGAAAGARDGAGNKGGPISSRLPTAQRAARPGSPAPTFPARRVRPRQPDEHRPCSPPALLVHDGKSGAKTRVQAFRSTWLGLAECDHGGHKPGASQRSAQRHTSVQRRRSAAGVLLA